MPYLHRHPKGTPPMATSQTIVLESAAIIGHYYLKSEFDNLKDFVKDSEWFQERKLGNIPVGECFNLFLSWVKGYNYYHCLVCSCVDENDKFLNNNLYADFDELYNEFK